MALIRVIYKSGVSGLGPRGAVVEIPDEDVVRYGSFIEVLAEPESLETVDDEETLEEEEVHDLEEETVEDEDEDDELAAFQAEYDALEEELDTEDE